MDEQKLVEEATKIPTPSECIFPKLDHASDYVVRTIREEEKATRVALSLCRDMYKILYYEEYTVKPKDNNMWWATSLCSTGEIGILRSITKESTRWSSLALRHILRYLRSAQSVSQLASNAPELFSLLFNQSLAEAANQVSEQQAAASKEWEQSAVVTFGKNEEMALHEHHAPPKLKVPDLIQRIYNLANTTLDHFTDTGACYVYDGVPLLEAEEVNDVLTPELLALKLVHQVSVLSQEKTLSMDMYLDFSGSMSTQFHTKDAGGLDYARVCGFMADILWRHGIINNTYLFNSQIHEIYKKKNGTVHKIQRPSDFLVIEPAGGTDFNNVLLHSKNKPAVVFTDGDANADGSTPMNENLMWVVFNRSNTGEHLYGNAILRKFIDRGRVIGICTDNMKVYEVHRPDYYRKEV